MCGKRICCHNYWTLQVTQFLLLQAQRLMRQWGLQNTYFMAKTLSERLVMSFDQQPFPVCIVRPSLIGCVAGDPFPGYIGNSSGFTSLILGSLAGTHRTQTPCTRNVSYFQAAKLKTYRLCAHNRIKTLLCSSFASHLGKPFVAYTHSSTLFASLDPYQNQSLRSDRISLGCDISGKK